MLLVNKVSSIGGMFFFVIFARYRRHS